MKPRVIIHRVSQRFLLDYVKPEEPISKSRIQSEIKTEPKSISRKRKQSVSDDNDTKPNTIVLRKRKSVSIIEIENKKPRKRRNKKPNSRFAFSNKFFHNDYFYLEKQIPIREPSPLPIIDRSVHYRTCFSTRK